MSSAPDASALNIDLWPKAKFETDVVTPLSILRRQAALLGQKTQQLVTADVSTSTNSDRVMHDFKLVVPALENYRYELFSVIHRIDQIYPVSGYFDGTNTPGIHDQPAFLQWLKQVLSSESTLRKVDALMAQAKG